MASPYKAEPRRKNKLNRQDAKRNRKNKTLTFTPTGARRRQVNLQKKTVFVPELNRKIIVNVSAKGLKTMKKRGAYQTLKKAGIVN